MTSNLSIESEQGTLLFGNSQSTLKRKSSPPPPPRENKQFLRLNLTTETVTLLPIKHLTEVATISSEKVASMPHMSPWIMGTHNWRGNILWLVDLGYLVGLKPLYQQVSSSTYTAAILQFFPKNAESQAVGLVVRQVGSIERCDADSIQPISLSASDTKLAKFLQGYWLKSESEVLAVLEPDSILQAISQSP